MNTSFLQINKRYTGLIRQKVFIHALKFQTFNLSVFSETQFHIKQNQPQ